MFEILGYYSGEVEVVDTAESMSEAMYLQGEYRLAFGNEWRIVIRKER